MPKQINILMEDNYPFGSCEEYASPNTKILVRQIIETDEKLIHKNQIMHKCKLIKKLSENGIAVAIHSILQEDDSVHILYEYVPIKLEKWIQNINQEFIEKFSSEIRDFAQSLAQCHILTQFQLSDIGMDQNYNPKYFLGLNFQVNKHEKKQPLYQIYLKQIDNLFKPYISRSKSKFQGVYQRRPDKLSDTKQLKGIIQYINSKEKQNSLQQIEKYQSNTRLLNKKKSTQYLKTSQNFSIAKLRKHQSINVNFGKLVNFDNNPNSKQRKQSALSVLSSSSNIRLNNLVRRINQLKFHAQHIMSPSLKNNSIPLLSEENSLKNSPKRLNTVANQKQQNFSYSKRSTRSPEMSDFFGQFNKKSQEQPFGFMSIQNAMKLTQKLAGGLLINSKNLKKNQSLKQREYQGMVQSDNKYYKDFANVLEDSTHQQILNSQQMNDLQVKTKQKSPKHQYLEYKQKKTQNHKRNKSRDYIDINYTDQSNKFINGVDNQQEGIYNFDQNQADLRKTFKAIDSKKSQLKSRSKQKSMQNYQKCNAMTNDLKNRVKNAIQNSKYLISQFKRDQ